MAEGTPRAQRDERLGLAIDAARRGSEAGYTEIYRLLAGTVAGYVRGRGVTEADDVTNEVFVGAFCRLETFVGGAPEFRSWLFGIAWNKSCDWHRAAARRASTVGGHDATLAGIVGGDGEADAIEHLGAADVERLLSILTDDQRDVILLRVVADLSLAETANALRKPITAVKALQHRALAALGREISPTPVSPPLAETNTGVR